MRLFLILIMTLSTVGCQAQLQKWQKDRMVKHLSRLNNYHGHIKWNIAGEEVAETEIWFEAPNRFLSVSKSGEIARSDGVTMEFYDPKTKFHSVFRNLPPVKASNAKRLIRDLFDQSMQIYAFTLGQTGKMAGLGVIELQSKPRGESVIVSAKSQILDEYSFPLKSVVNFKGGQSASYEFTDITFNKKFKLPKAKIPAMVFKLEWDFNAATPLEVEKLKQFKNLNLEKILKRETGEILTYYKDGAQFASVLRYKNLGMPPRPRGITVKIGAQNGFLMPGPVSNTLTVTSGDTTSLYTSNLLIDHLIEFASRLN